MAWREDLSKPPAPSEWSNAVKNCKRLREGFREYVQKMHIQDGFGEPRKNLRSTSLGAMILLSGIQFDSSFINIPRR